MNKTDGVHYTTALQHLGVIRVAGEEALQFLHNQLTQDMLSHTGEEARRSGWCSAKGRLLASFVSVLHDDAVLLVGSADLLDAVLKRLRMFVLRTKCTLENATDRFVLVGSYCHVNDAHCDDWYSRVPEVTAFLPVRQTVQGGVQIQLPVGSGDAAQWSHQLNIYPRYSDSSPLPTGDARHTQLWQWLEVMTGVALVSEAVREAFVPQMLNYESTAAVNFKKGCYPGQEVVARSQFRGKLKRRAFLARSSSSVSAGAAVYHSSDGSNPVGIVVQAAQHPDAGWACIFSAAITAAESGTLHVQSPDGAALTLLPLPYELLQDI